MSWDVFMSKTPVDELSEANFESIGKRDWVIQNICEILPNVDFSDPSWGVYHDDECSIEVNLGDDEDIENLMFHIRGNGNRPIFILKEISVKLNCFAMDGSTGEAMNFDEKDEDSFKQWQAYRDKILGRK